MNHPSYQAAEGTDTQVLLPQLLLFYHAEDASKDQHDSLVSLALKSGLKIEVINVAFVDETVVLPTPPLVYRLGRIGVPVEQYTLVKTGPSWQALLTKGNQRDIYQKARDEVSKDLAPGPSNVFFQYMMSWWMRRYFLEVSALDPGVQQDALAQFALGHVPSKPSASHKDSATQAIEPFFDEADEVHPRFRLDEREYPNKDVEEQMVEAIRNNTMSPERKMEHIQNVVDLVVSCGLQIKLTPDEGPPIYMSPETKDAQSIAPSEFLALMTPLVYQTNITNMEFVHPSISESQASTKPLVRTD